MISKLTLEESESFNKLGLIINKNFVNVYKIEDILLSSCDYVYGYFKEGKLVGFIHIIKLYETMDIVNIVVDPNYRNMGVASSLLSYVFNLYTDVENILLEVNENNIAAINLYIKNNFKVINKRLNYYGNDSALIMKRDVKNEEC